MKYCVNNDYVTTNSTIFWRHIRGIEDLDYFEKSFDTWNDLLVLNPSTRKEVFKYLYDRVDIDE